MPELKINANVTADPFVKFDRYSNLNKLKRIYAYIKRFIVNLRNPKNKITGVLSHQELQESFYFLCSMSQLVFSA